MKGRISWNEFRDMGGFWLVNRVLHLFGLVLAYLEEEDGTITGVYPSRTKFFGFTEEIDEENLGRVRRMMRLVPDP